MIRHTGFLLIFKDESVYVCVWVPVCVYLRYWGLPAHVLQRGGGETGRACRPLLKEENYTFRILPQFKNQVFQLPAHLVKRIQTHMNPKLNSFNLSFNLCVKWNSHHCLLINLDHFIASMDLPCQVCRWLKNKQLKPSRSHFALLE